MLSFKENEIQGKIIAWALISVNLVLLPGISLDPINSPKLLALGVFGVVSLVLFVRNLKHEKNSLKQWHVVIALLLILQSIISFLVSGGNSAQFFGVFGRNTGLLALISLIVIFLLASVNRDVQFVDKIASAFMLTCFFAIMYGLLQVFGLDPIAWEPSGYTKIFGFLGNPNFQSAYLGITGSILISQILDLNNTLKIRLVSILAVITIVFIIYKSESEQGFLVLTVGFFINICMFFAKKRNLLALTISSTAAISFGIISVFGLIGKGFFSSILYTDSIQFRGDYWRAAWKIGLDNPAFGVGIDGFGEKYRLYRDQVATLRRGPDVVSNSPHNVFLDYLTNSGFLAITLYVLLHIITVVSIFRQLKRNTNISSKYIGLVSAWFAYIAQSVISVNQLGLAIAGWILMGTIIGSGLNSQKENFIKPEVRNPKLLGTSKKTPIQPGLLMLIYTSIGFGVLISIVPTIRNVEIVSALKSGNAERIEKVALAKPTQAQLLFNVGSIFLNNNLEEQSLKIARIGVKNFPNSYELWNFLSVQPTATAEEIAIANSQKLALDPLNPDLK